MITQNCDLYNRAAWDDTNLVSTVFSVVIRRYFVTGSPDETSHANDRVFE
jgi:hypothetical protein